MKPKLEHGVASGPGEKENVREDSAGVMLVMPTISEEKAGLVMFVWHFCKHS